MKKKIVLIAFILLLIVCMALLLPQEKDYDYLRLHIRANSNSSVDQNVKYKIKDELVNFLSPYFSGVKSKEEAVKIVESLTNSLQQKCAKVLKDNGFYYSVNIKIANEFFPTRTYSNTTLESGYYDAVIVELGEAVGDNWWCVMYPPLCFVNKNENLMQISFKSKILEWFKEVFG